MAWQRQISRHLEYLTQVARRAGDPGDRLLAVLEGYAMISHEHHGTALAKAWHRGEHAARAAQQLHDFIRSLLTQGVESGDIRDDVPAHELASYCLHALAAANTLPSTAAVRRLVMATLAGLQPS
jgi:hypothetical protein